MNVHIEKVKRMHQIHVEDTATDGDLSHSPSSFRAQVPFPVHGCMVRLKIEFTDDPEVIIVLKVRLQGSEDRILARSYLDASGQNDYFVWHWEGLHDIDENIVFSYETAVDGTIADFDGSIIQEWTFFELTK